MEELPTLIPKTESKDKFDSLTDRPVSEEHPASRIQTTHSRSSAKADDTVLNQIATITAVVVHAVFRIFSEVGQATE